MFKFAMFVLLITKATLLFAGSMEAISDREMSLVSGFDGIALDLELRANADASGAPISGGNFNGCVNSGSVTNNDCKLGVQLANRDGTWLVMKDYFFVLKFTNLYLDVAVNPSSATSHADAAQFENSDGVALIPTANGLPNLSLSFPNDAATAYNDVEMSLVIGRLAVEYDSGPTLGYTRDESGGSILGLRIQDTAGGPAGIDVDGQMGIFGF